MAISTQYNPQADLNERLFAAGASKTVYALVTPETEAAKAATFGNDGDKTRTAYLEQFRDAWTAKQDRFHEHFFDVWCKWSNPVVDLDRREFPFYYPTAGASEPLRHLIFDFAAKGGKTIHIFHGEYEGYKAMAEAAGLRVEEHTRDGNEGWHTPFGGRLNRIASRMSWSKDLFFISQPSAIDGNVWPEFNEFISKMPDNSVVIDLTYVGAVPFVEERFDMNLPSVRNVVFSLSKPFGAYYDRIGGVFCRSEDLGLFGNKWFKSLTALRLGSILMESHDVFFMALQYKELQTKCAFQASENLGFDIRPSDVYLLGAAISDMDTEMAGYLRRAGRLRLCLTPGMAQELSVRGIGDDQ